MHIDMYEASVPTRPIMIRPGDRIVTGPNTTHAVVAVEPRLDGARITLRNSRGETYMAFRRSPLNVFHP